MKKSSLGLLFIIVFGSACQAMQPATPTVRSTLAAESSTFITQSSLSTQSASSQTHTPVPATPTLLPPTPPPTQTPVPATKTLPPALAPEEIIQSFLDEQARNGEFSGSVLIALDGIPILQQAYGMADRSLEVPNQIDTKFNLGSMDKMFTAIAIMQLVEQGKLSLHEKIGTYLPAYPNPEIADTVTIHQLLTHSSGFGNYFDSPLYLEKHNQVRSLNDYFALFTDTPLLFEPGSQFAYSNSGYIVLGLIIEAVSGISYYDYVQEHIFEPNGMLDTACFELDAVNTNLAIGYTTREWNGNDTGQIRDNGSMVPVRGGSAGGGYSTAPDLLSFRNALVNYQLLSPESTKLLLEGKIQVMDQVKYAYGFFRPDRARPTQSRAWRRISRDMQYS